MIRLRFIIPFLCAASLLLIFSCKKKEDNTISDAPQISFKTSTGYVYTNMFVSPGQTVKMGITASKNGDNPLSKFIVAQKLNANSPVDVDSVFLSGASANTYERDYSVTMSNQPGIEQYTFTIISQNGLSNAVSIIFTVQ